MKLVEFKENDYDLLYDYMKPLWIETYEHIIGINQVEFLLDKYFNLNNIKNYINKGYQYFKIVDEGLTRGVVIYYIDTDYIYLDKLYLPKEERGKGYPNFVFNELLKVKKKIILNVNQANYRALNCYKKNGFEILEEEHINLGNNMINIDYKMIKEDKIMVHKEFYTLSNGVKIPKVALGTWQSKSGEECYNAVKWALEAGYRHIDTANAYGNEDSVGQAIKDSGIPREEIFITTKIPAEVKTYDGALQCFNDSMQKLGVDVIDLILIHAPWPWSHVGMDCTEGNIEVWKLLVELYEKKLVRAIGVSNFHDYNIKPIFEATGVMPHVNQIRYFIGNTQNAIVEYCEANNILIQAYSPLATGNLVNDEILGKIAEKYNTTIPKICIRYCIQKNTLPLPKSVTKSRIEDNLDINFVISDEDMSYLDSLKEIGPTRPLRT